MFGCFWIFRSGDWSGVILHGIQEVPHIGSLVRLVVYGKASEAILTGDNEEDVFIAAAQLGRGRIVAISDRRYLSQFQDGNDDPVLNKLQQNIKKWVTRDACGTSNKCIAAAGKKLNASQLHRHKIIVWDGGRATISSGDVAAFIRNGGGFVTAVTTWYWLASYPGKQLKDMPYYDVLASAGITFTRVTVEKTRDMFPVGRNKAEGSNLWRLVTKGRNNLDQLLNKFILFEEIQWIPNLESTELSDGLDSIFEECDLHVRLNVPTAQTPVKGHRNVLILQLWLLIARARNKISKARGIASFPGDFTDDSPPTQTRSVNVTSIMNEWHNTGCYAPAGRTIRS